MSLSIYNSTIVPLDVSGVFTGQYDNILDFAEINVSIKCDTSFQLECIYSTNKDNENFVLTNAISASANTQFFKFDPLERYFKLRITNDSSGNMTELNVQTIYKTSTAFTSDFNVDISGQVVDISGQVVDISGQSVLVSGAVGILGNTYDPSGAQYVNVNNSNLAVRLFDSNNLPVSSTSGSLNTFITNTTDIPVDISGQTVLIGTNPVIVKEKPTYSMSLDALSKTSQVIRTNAGCLNGFHLSNIGGSGPAYVKFYNASSATFGDVSLMTIILHKDTQIYINAGNMNFSSALCCRAVDAYADSTNSSASGNVSITAFLTGYTE